MQDYSSHTFIHFLKEFQLIISTVQCEDTTQKSIQTHNHLNGWFVFFLFRSSKILFQMD